MAICTLIPFILVFTAVNGEVQIIMIPCCRFPRALRMTGLTGCWKLGSLMIRVVGLIVIVLVTSKTCVWGVVVITVMAGCALICYGGMCPDQRIIIVMIRKQRRIPVRISGMACNTICRQTKRGVAWIARLCIIRHVTGIAFCRRVLISVGMTRCTVHICMPLGQREA